MSTHDRPLAMLQAQALGNSRRWFPELHERGQLELIIHMALGLAGEAGEVANLVKKINRGPRSGPGGIAPWTFEQYDALTDELADVLTYTLNLAGLLGIDLAATFDRKQGVCEERWGTGWPNDNGCVKPTPVDTRPGRDAAELAAMHQRTQRVSAGFDPPPPGVPTGFVAEPEPACEVCGHRAHTGECGAVVLAGGQGIGRAPAPEPCTCRLSELTQRIPAMVRP